MESFKEVILFIGYLNSFEKVRNNADFSNILKRHIL